MDYLTVGALLLLALVIGGYGALKWAQFSEDEKRLAVWELVRAAEQMFDGDGQGARRLRYVIDELKKRYPAAPVNVLRHMVEAAVWQLRNSRNEQLMIVGELDAAEDDTARWN